MRHGCRSTLIGLVALSMACSSSGRVSDAGRADGAPAPHDGGGSERDADPERDCDPSRDEDGDGIPDALEGDGDDDGDGAPNAEDPDTDGDGVPDWTETEGFGPCEPPDSDGDGVPDHRETDSDGDGLDDADERWEHGTDPRSADTDGDGYSDLLETCGTTTDPLDADSAPADTDHVVELAEGQSATVRIDAVTPAPPPPRSPDVYALLDTPDEEARASFADRMVGLLEAMPEARVGAGQLSDFPFCEDLGEGHCYGNFGDKPFEHMHDLGRAPDSLRSALSTSGLTFAGWDPHGSHVEALYQAATGEGGTWQYPLYGRTHSLPPAPCPEGGLGYPCFDPDSLPVIVLGAKRTWNNDGGHGDPEAYPDGRPYRNIVPAPHEFAEARDALCAIDAAFVGVAFETSFVDDAYRQRHELEAMARAVGAVGPDGQPFVLEAPGGEVPYGVVDAVDTLSSEPRPEDVTTRIAADGACGGDADPAAFVTEIRTLETDPEGYARRDGGVFVATQPETPVAFELSLRNEVTRPKDRMRVFHIRVAVTGRCDREIAVRHVYVVVPPVETELI